MGSRFRFHEFMEFESRDVPASLSAHVNDGTPTGYNISAQFSTPIGVDPNQPQQTFTLNDLTATKSAPPNSPPVPAYTVQSGTQATAVYNSGVLTGVTGILTNGSDTINVTVGSQNQPTVQTDGYSAPAALDGADTQATFTLPDGTTGAISYSIDADSVDASQPSQAIPATSLNLNIGGQNYSAGSPAFTTAPTVTYAGGVFTGINFVLNTLGTPNFAYTSITLNGLTATADLVGGGQYVADMVAQTSLILDFSKAAAPQNIQFIITGQLADGTKIVGSLTIPAGTKPGVQRDLFFSALEDAGLKPTLSGENRLIIKSSTKSVLKSLDFTAAGGMWTGPALVGMTDNANTTPAFTINGKAVPLTP